MYIDTGAYNPLDVCSESACCSRPVIDLLFAHEYRRTTELSARETAADIDLSCMLLTKVSLTDFGLWICCKVAEIVTLVFALCADLDV